MGHTKTDCGKSLILEREKELGGILNQCIHNGFGLHTFREELTGSEYAWRYITQLQGTSIEIMTDVMVLDIAAEDHEAETVHVPVAQSASRETGPVVYENMETEAPPAGDVRSKQIGAFPKKLFFP